MKSVLVTILAGTLLVSASVAFAQGGPAGDVDIRYDFGTTKVVVVNASVPWTSTGVLVVPGQLLSIVAKGQATTVLTSTQIVFTGPEGWGGGPSNPNHPVPYASQWSLIGKIGTNGIPFSVGGAVAIQTLVAGELYLGYNDTVFGDNFGFFVAYITPPYSPTSAVGDVGTSSSRFGSNSPNPFNLSTRIDFELKSPSLVRVEILDVQGRLVNTLLSEDRPIGRHSVIWDGMDSNGSRVPSGAYYYRICSAGGAELNRMMLIK